MRAFPLLSICALVALALAVAGCSPGAGTAAQGATATAAASPTGAGLTVVPAVTAISTAVVTATTPLSTPLAAGTPAPRPTPEGTPPAPLAALDVLALYSANNTLARRDLVQLDDGPEELLFTITGPAEVVTGEFASSLGVLTYDPVYWEWSLAWSSDNITGTAHPLLSANQSGLGGYNGGDLLRSGSPIMALRSTDRSGRAYLGLWRWNRETSQGEPLKMTPAEGGAERDALFTADLDLNVVDLDDDGVYEVVADNVAGVQVWKWDGAKYAPEGGLR